MYIPLTPLLLIFLTSPVFSSSPECADAISFYPHCNFVGLVHFSVVLRTYCILVCRGVYWCSCRLAVCTDGQALQC